MSDDVVSLPRIFSEKEAATYLRMTPDRLARERRDGKIGHTWSGGRAVYLEKHLLEYLEKGEQPCRVAHRKKTSFTKRATGGSVVAKAPLTSSVVLTTPPPDALTDLRLAQEIWG